MFEMNNFNFSIFFQRILLSNGICFAIGCSSVHQHERVSVGTDVVYSLDSLVKHGLTLELYYSMENRTDSCLTIIPINCDSNVRYGLFDMELFSNDASKKSRKSLIESTDGTISTPMIDFIWTESNSFQLAPRNRSSGIVYINLDLCGIGDAFDVRSLRITSRLKNAIFVNRTTCRIKKNDWSSEIRLVNK
jgi:hypothetical protein